MLHAAAMVVEKFVTICVGAETKFNALVLLKRETCESHDGNV